MEQVELAGDCGRGMSELVFPSLVEFLAGDAGGDKITKERPISMTILGGKEMDKGMLEEKGVGAFGRGRGREQRRGDGVHGVHGGSVGWSGGRSVG